jgi:hypothetical protein
LAVLGFEFGLMIARHMLLPLEPLHQWDVNLDGLLKEGWLGHKYLPNMY